MAYLGASLTSPFAIYSLALAGRGTEMDEEQAATFAKELSDLSKEHSEALRAAIFGGMSKEEAAVYDTRAERISKLGSLLGRSYPL